MEILQILATAILQGVGFTMGVLIVAATIIFIVKQKMQDMQLLNWINIFKNFKR